jgi:hypothetical protein
MVLLPAAVLTLPVYQCLVRVESAEQAQSRQAARAVQLAWWFLRGRSQLGRSSGPRFVAQLGLGSAVEREVCWRNGMQRRVPVARMSAVRPVSARVMLLRVTAAVPVGASHKMHGNPRRENPLEATWGIPAPMTARVVKATRVILIRTSAAPTLVLPGVSPSRVVERPAQAEAPPSACRAGP